MNFWKRKDGREPEPEQEPELVDQAFVIFTLSDSNSLDVTMGWPADEDYDIKPFAEMLAWLNEGKLVGAQLAAAAINASKSNVPHQAMVIHAALDRVASRTKTTKEKSNSDSPIIPPSKVTPNQMRLHGHA